MLSGYVLGYKIVPVSPYDSKVDTSCVGKRVVIAACWCKQKLVVV